MMSDLADVRLSMLRDNDLTATVTIPKDNTLPPTRLPHDPMHDKIPIGWREWIALPELAIPAIKVKIDTGARTSALHVFGLETYSWSGRTWVRFGLHPLQKRIDIALSCTAEMIDERAVSDSGGHREHRPIIATRLRLGDREWPIEISLTNREDMLFRMLLGRTALRGRVIIDPQMSYLCGRKLKRAYRSWPTNPIRHES